MCSRGAVVLLAAVLVPVVSAEPTAAVLIGGDQCQRGTPRWQPKNAATQLLNGVLTIGPYEAVRIGRDPDWSIDPFRSTTWVERYHTLLWTEPLRAAYLQTGDVAYLDAWRGYVQDWIDDNPRAEPPSPGSWADRTTAVRAQILACAIDWFPAAPLYRTSLSEHAATLAEPSFYVGRSNHALDQNLGLLAAGCKLAERGWIELARTRIAKLVVESIDPSGGLNEGSIAYALLNHTWYGEAIDRLNACGEPIPTEVRQRRRLLELFITHAAHPDGTTPVIGDAWRARLPAGGWPEADYVRTLGERGRAPQQRSRWYERAGWAFDRSSWTNADATHLVLRTGRVPIHNHADQGSLVLSGGGRRLLDEGGFLGYGSPLSLRYFYVPQAHNLLLVDGGRYVPTDAIVQRRAGPGYTFFRMRLPIWQGIRWTRTVLSIDGGRIVVVSDHADARKSRTWRQTWHLRPSSHPAVGRSQVVTRFTRGNLRLAWAQAPDDIRVVAGQMQPRMQGWIGTPKGRMFPMPTVEAITRGRQVRMVTVLGAGKRAPSIRILDRMIERDGYALRFRADDQLFRVRAAPGAVWVRRSR